METDIKDVTSTDEKITEKYTLVLHNDEENTFHHVINCLVKICGHEPSQAEQCAMITHQNGKCDVKSGELDELKTIKINLNEAGLEATIQK